MTNGLFRGGWGTLTQQFLQASEGWHASSFQGTISRGPRPLQMLTQCSGAHCLKQLSSLTQWTLHGANGNLIYVTLSAKPSSESWTQSWLIMPGSYQFCELLSLSFLYLVAVKWLKIFSERLTLETLGLIKHQRFTENPRGSDHKLPQWLLTWYFTEYSFLFHRDRSTPLLANRPALVTWPNYFLG